MASNLVTSSGRSKTTPINDVLEQLHKGHVLMKCRGSSKKYDRHFYVGPDCLSFGYDDSKKWWKKGVNDDSKVYISEVNEIRDGPRTDVFVKQKLDIPDDRCFSFVLGDKHRTLDLVAPTEAVQQLWVKGMKYLLKRKEEANLAVQQDLWLRELFKVADKNNDRVLTLKEIVNLLKHLNIEVDLDTAKTVFEVADTNKVRNKKGEDCLDIDEFMEFYRKITKRDEVEDLFEKYNYAGKYLEATELQNFFEDEQNMKVSIETCEQLIERHEPCPEVKELKMMSMDGFNALFNAPTMDIFNPKYNKVYMDMDRPLAHYFIDSSHNTYLVADQLVGDSAVEAYIRALKRGNRCIELDCWDGHDDEPVIYHGHTLTSKILFKDVITAVNTYAFEASEYPVILSIENHCSLELQRKMAFHMRQILGDKLVTVPVGNDMKQLPSPEFYKGKILVKGKKCKLFPRVLEALAAPKGKKISGNISLDDYDDGEVSDEDEAADIEDEQVKEEVKQKKNCTKLKLAKELSDTVVIFQSVHFIDFEQSKEKDNFKQMSSFGENKAVKLAEDCPTDWIQLNARQVSRVYPAGKRTDSSNYDPVPMWLAGNQIVALNYQTPDEPMHCYKGMFLDNGGCGYVLKPMYMNKEDSTFNPYGPFNVDWKRHFKLKIISGYQLPKKKNDKAKNILDPYVKVEIQGVKDDCQTQRTEPVENNGFHPVWNKYLDFDLNCPDLAIVNFRVIDNQVRARDHMVAQYSLPFRCIQNGFHTVHLKSKYGEPIWGSQLLVHCWITQG